MTFKEVQDLIKLVTKSKLSEFKMEEGDFKVSIRTEHYQKGSSAAPQIVSVPAAAMPAVPQPLPAAAPAGPTQTAADRQEGQSEKKDETKYLEIKSPMVGTFYRSANPEKPPYVQVGDTVKAGSVVCIVEAMKLFNEIESEISGKIVKVMIEDAQPVEYDQVLFLVEP